MFLRNFGNPRGGPRHAAKFMKESCHFTFFNLDNDFFNYFLRSYITLRSETFAARNFRMSRSATVVYFQIGKVNGISSEKDSLK